MQASAKANLATGKRPAAKKNEVPIAKPERLTVARWLIWRFRAQPEELEDWQPEDVAAQLGQAGNLADAPAITANRSVERPNSFVRLSLKRRRRPHSSRPHRATGTAERAGHEDGPADRPVSVAEAGPRCTRSRRMGNHCGDDEEDVATTADRDLEELCRDGLPVSWPSGRQDRRTDEKQPALPADTAPASSSRCHVRKAPPIDSPGEEIASALEELAALEKDGLKVSWR